MEQIISEISELEKHARNTSDEMWKETSWSKFFTEKVNKALFQTPIYKEIEKDFRKIFLEIKEIYPKISIGNEYEREFLRLTAMLDILTAKAIEQRDPNLPILIGDSTTPYTTARCKILYDYMDYRNDYIVKCIDYFASLGKENAYWQLCVEYLKKHYSGDREKISPQDMIDYLYYSSHSGKMEISTENYVNLQEVIARIESFQTVAKEINNRTETLTDNHAYHVYRYITSYLEDELILCDVLKNGFYGKQPNFADRIISFVSNSRILSLPDNSKALLPMFDDNKRSKF